MREVVSDTSGEMIEQAERHPISSGHFSVTASRSSKRHFTGAELQN